MNNNGKELDNDFIFKAMGVGHAAIDFMEEVHECEPNVIIPAMCTIIDGYCEEHNLSPKAFCEELVENISEMRTMQGSMFGGDE